LSSVVLRNQTVTENLNVLDYESYITVTDLILENKIPELLMSFNDILSKGFDSHHFVSGLASHFRDLLVSKTPSTLSWKLENKLKKCMDSNHRNVVNFFVKRNRYCK
jgi:DNA polymerase III gamma/tau subunit